MRPFIIGVIVGARRFAFVRIVGVRQVGAVMVLQMGVQSELPGPYRAAILDDLEGLV